MGFFSILETFFFLSLGITFVLIIMLVYHFKGRLVSIEDKYHTMFDIMNSMVKEMKNIRESVMTIQTVSQPVSQPAPGSSSGFPVNFMNLFQGGGPQMFSTYQNRDDDDDDDEDEDEDDEDNTEEYKKIVVSDTELESDDENTDIKIISVNIGENEEEGSLAELEEENVIEQIDVDEEPSEPDNTVEDEPTNQVAKQYMEYKKMDISILRTMAVSRGLATDTKKMKKNELVKLLEQSE